MKMWPTMQRGGVDYAHIPMIADNEGMILHKSMGPKSPYLFSNWAKKFGTRKGIQQALEKLILIDRCKAFEWNNIMRHYAIHYFALEAEAGGAIVGTTPWQERGWFTDLTDLDVSDLLHATHLLEGLNK